jgi:hypothetical protein
VVPEEKKKNAQIEKRKEGDNEENQTCKAKENAIIIWASLEWRLTTLNNKKRLSGTTIINTISLMML